MPTFRIHYTVPPKQQHEQPQRDTTDWVCPTGYTAKRARLSFKQQSPSAAVGTVLRLPE
jgi:hypothetical protein